MAHSPVNRAGSLVVDRRTGTTTRGARSPHSGLVVLADAVSYGYACLVVLATLQFDLQFRLFEGIVIMAIFVVLRVLAREVRAEHRARTLGAARRRADHRRSSPERWSQEQRDGVGRRIDSRA